jgi:hypothetical protein
MAIRDTDARPKRLSRRDFGHRAALTLAGGTLTATGMLGSGEAVAANGKASEQPMTPHAQSGPRAPLPPGAEIEAKLRHIFERYGDRLSEKQRKKMRELVTDHVRMLESIRRVQVRNSDPPAAVLRLLDGGGTASRG